MAIIPLTNKRIRIHFVGINGISMSALAVYCLKRGYEVTGSDKNYEAACQRFAGTGVRIFAEHNASNVHGADAVIYTSAVEKDNRELSEAAKLGIPLIKRSELLGKIAAEYKTFVAVSGSHGKTTATAMIAHVLSCADIHPTAFIGGEDNDFGNLLFDIAGKKDIIVAEACEYKKNFLDLKPAVSVVLNVDNDHKDSYTDMDDMVNSFTKFIGESIAVVNVDDEYSERLFNKATVTFGIKAPAVYTASNIRADCGKYSFTVFKSGVRLGRIHLFVNGRHNIYNALAAVATADILGVDFNVCRIALQKFTGVKRRNEKVGEVAGKSVYCDYAHHPKEICAELTAFSKMKENPLVVFQPHTYSRTKTLLGDFTAALKKADTVIIYKTYAAREKFDPEGSAYTLYTTLKENGTDVFYAEKPDELKAFMTCFSKEKTCVLCLGAGDIYDVVTKICKQ